MQVDEVAEGLGALELAGDWRDAKVQISVYAAGPSLRVLAQAERLAQIAAFAGGLGAPTPRLLFYKGGRFACRTAAVRFSQ